MSGFATLSRDGSVAVITINNPPVNAIAPGLAEEILECVEQAHADPQVSAVVLIGGGRTFVAGYDIKEFVRIVNGERPPEVSLNAILNQIEDAKKPVIAAIHGTALGGGLELALACHYRVATPSAQLGQPEVKLGLIPGAGGTQRLPRLVGSTIAADMCAFGDPVPARRAVLMGLVDEIVEGDLLTGAVEFARRQTSPRRARDVGDRQSTFIFPNLTRMRGREAPRRALEAIECASRMPFEEGLAHEARLFQECLFSTESKCLVHLFFGEREVGKVPGVPDKVPFEVRAAAVIGAGTMGSGIAMTYANVGVPVLLKETTQEALDRGLATIRKNYQSTVAKGRMTQTDMDRRIHLIAPTLSYDGFERADIIVEAVFEDMSLKRAVFSELDQIAKPGAILATNSSSLNIDEIAGVTGRPRQVIGHHFFSPAHVMKLLEIVVGAATAPEVIGRSLTLARRLGKIAVVVGNCKGFVGNRMFHPYRREAQFLVEEGAAYTEVDKVLYDFGMAMGPLTVGDLAGLDVGWRIRQQYQHLEKPGVRKALMEDRLCEMGRFGQKTGVGWYRYDEKRKAIPDPRVEELAVELAAQAGLARRAIPADEILDRCLWALVNEGCRVLEEGIALRPVDIDVIYVHGYGFPAHKGGPMKYAEMTGWRRVYDRVCEFERTHGELWSPAPMLRKLAGA